MSGPIFGNSSTLTGSSGGNRHLVEFRCGRMNLVGKTVHPDTRKGLVYLYQAEDGLIHFCWKERTTGKVEDDLIIFPDDCEFKRVTDCKTGRVFILKFKSSSRKLFFWMQEPKTDKDEEHCRHVNDIMNNPPSVSTGRGGSSGSGSGSDSSDLQYMLNNMSQQQLMQLFGGVSQMGLSSLLGSMRSENALSRLSSSRTTTTTSTTTTTTTTTTSSSTTTTTSSSTTTTTTTSSSSTTPLAATPTTTATTTTPSAPKRATRRSNATDNSATATASGGSIATSEGDESSEPNFKISLSDLQHYLSGIPRPNRSNTTDSSGVIDISGPNIDLSSAINAETVNNVIKNCDLERTNTLVSHLPVLNNTSDNVETVGTNNKEDVTKQIKDTISSPQFQQALSMFSSALQSGQLAPVVSQFELSSEAIAAANIGDLEQFVKAMEKNAKSKDAEIKKSDKDDTSK